MFILAFVIAYLIGSISFSYLITKKIKKVDIREFGSGNAGATNTLRVLGVGPAVTVLLLDVLKGVVAVLFAMVLNLDSWAVAATGLFAILGHNFPVFYGFKGGKGVATTIGAFVMLMYSPALAAGVFAIILIILTRYVSLGSLIFIIFTPIFSLYVGDNPLSYTYIGLIIALLAIWQHRTNIKRLIRGEENRLGKKTKDI
ncbi:acyl-phosphate glycerol-3-phosphate acyltransferase [Scopulibacillus darangshiensis]|uniref:Glycerol-3-phosphate acyltransferase n=1 Tax=Scopulibacillus darangshiensis TaxID=442528 RepID=A0A4R2P9R2_9BACL|nr:glycerol-3-phosphate 1-O-acyltransferase PlsY [Scopulibacillus darangshiensis]TCP31657.1 acyl-phosphate glycerol-3-phosphate acyltransferase [Scopulibacillus darangshiensis]